MREILERHAERLSASERSALWAVVARPRVTEPRDALRPALLAASTLAVLGAAAVMLSIWASPPASVEEGRRSASTVPTPPSLSLPVPREAAVTRPVKVRPSVAGRALSPAPIAPLAVALPEAVDRVVAVPSTPPVVAPGVGSVVGIAVDQQKNPVAHAHVVVLGTRQGAQTDERGEFSIRGVPTGRWQARLMAIGYEPSTQEISVGTGENAPLRFTLGQQLVVKDLATLQVRGEKRIDTKSSSSIQSLSSVPLREIPVNNLSEARVKDGMVVGPGGELHFRGGRSGETRFQSDGAFVAPMPPVVPTTGGSRLPNDEAFDSMFFRNYGVNPFIATDEDALSTFALDVDAGSYTLTRRFLELGVLPPADAVRVEEFVNYFPQGYPRFERDDFRILCDGAPSPFGRGYHLLRVGLKGRDIAERDRKPARLTFVIDVSGSMNREDRLELVKRALRLLVDQLRENDRVGIVVYGSSGRVVLEPIAAGGDSERSGRARILEAIDQLHPDGSTHAEEGLRLGYDMARRMHRPDAINRIVLCSDGVANVGRTGAASILAQVRSEADRGIQLTTIGFGMGNYNDVLMEQLADRGDGNHYYVDRLDEARRVFVENLTGTLQIIARDAKVQVEFDSTRVLRYRLLGFENRDVADRDFRNDKVDAGEIGAGHEVTALYEVKLAPGVTQGRLATVRLRYARPEHEGGGAPEVREIERRLDASALRRRFEDAPPRFRMSAAVAEFAEILRGSHWARESRLSDVLAVARSAARDLREDRVDELVRLVEQAAALKQASQDEREDSR